MSKTKIVELTEPIELEADGTQLTKLTIGTLKAKHLRAFPKGMFGGKTDQINPVKMVPVIAALCNVEEKIIDELSMTDFLTVVNEVSEQVEKSMGQSEPIGEV